VLSTHPCYFYVILLVEMHLDIAIGNGFESTIWSAKITKIGFRSMECAMCLYFGMILHERLLFIMSRVYPCTLFYVPLVLCSNSGQVKVERKMECKSMIGSCTEEDKYY
jgi:hypothetical protein